MAKTNMLMREKRRLKVAKKYAKRRAELKELIRDPKNGPEERAAAGIPEGLVRYSTGIEDVCDLIADLDQALAVIR